MMHRYLIAAGVGVISATLAIAADPAAKPADIILGDFESAAFDGWIATGTAFGDGPTQADLFKKLEIDNADGHGVASSERDGDGPTGTLTSGQFKIDRKYISFRIGGGDYERDTCVDLMIDGKIVRSATGARSDRMMPTTWDVSAFAGQVAQVQLIDRATGDWGHVNVDHIIMTDQPEWPALPAEPLYRESLRPQFHFTARQWTMNRLNPGQRQEGWVNDLNGLIYYDGEYHLFAQRWAKCWLHAVSRDLVHWTELQPAFWEEHDGSGVQSGTCVIDYENTSGLSPDKKNPPMVAFWSRFDNASQCLSYSLDHGRTWTRYEKNPLFVFPERDPKVFWYAPAKHWVMMMYGNDAYHIFTSKNLLEWKDEKQSIPKSFECPDFFELPIDGDATNKKWVLIQGNGNYSIGTFDGTAFKEDTERLPCDIGDFYATQSWANTDTGDGRRIQTAWMRGSDFPDMPFSQQISFPCELTLHDTPDGLRIYRKPIKEIETVHAGHQSWVDRVLNAKQSLPLAAEGKQFHLKANLSLPDDGKMVLSVRGVPITFTAKGVTIAGRSGSVRDRVSGIEVLVDTASIEVFLNDGEVSITQFVLPKENGLSLKGENGSVAIRSIDLFPLRSAWPTDTTPGGPK